MIKTLSNANSHFIAINGHKIYKTEMNSLIKSEVIVYHDETKNVGIENLNGHVLLFIPVKTRIKIWRNNTQNVIKSDFNLGNYYINEEKYNELKSFAINEGDILLTAAVTIGKLAIIPNKFKQGIINQALMKITLDKNKILIPYFLNLFSFAPFRNRVLGSSHGATMKNISSVKNLKSLIIPLVKISEQKKIAKILSTEKKTGVIKKEEGKV